MRRCVPVIILEDQVPEIDESFMISIEGTNATTTVIIEDDDCKYYYIICVYHAYTVRDQYNSMRSILLDC